MIREPNKMTKVIEFNKKKIKDIYAIRTAIEHLCVDIIFDNNSIPFEELKKDLEMLKNSISADKEPDIAKIKDLDMAFHEAILYAADNQYCISIWRMIKSQISALYSRVSQIMILNHSDFAGISENAHKLIYDALSGSDRELTKALISKHNKDNVNGLLNSKLYSL